MNRNIEEWLRLNRHAHSAQRLSDIVSSPVVDFKIGDKVIYTNDNGVSFHNLTVIHISKHNVLWKYGNCIYLNKGSYWYPVKPEQLSLEDSKI